MGLGTAGSTLSLQQFLFDMRSVETRQVLGDRIDGEPGTREPPVRGVRDTSADASDGLEAILPIIILPSTKDCTEILLMRS